MCTVSTSKQPVSDHPPGPIDDRTKRARIRDAAIACFAASGVDGTGVREIAAQAGVSPALVTHHFGSKKGLRRACDQYIAALLQESRLESMGQGLSLDPIASLRSFDGKVPLIRYLARTLIDGSPEVSEMVDRLVDDAVHRLELGESLGLIRPASDHRGTAVVLVLWSLGAVVLHEHVRRLLDVDLTSDLAADLSTTMAYIGPALDIVGQGVMTEHAHAQYRQQFAAAERREDERD